MFARSFVVNVTTMNVYEVCSQMPISGGGGRSIDGLMSIGINWNEIPENLEREA